MKTIYISGKIAGCDYHEASSKFFTAWCEMRKRFSEERDGAEYPPMVINPMDMVGIPDGTWFDYMMRDLVYLRRCDTIYMLKDWKDSAGARIEHEFARILGLEIIYEEDEE